MQPEPLWKYFCDLTQLPRPSHHEHRVVQYLKDFAAARNLDFAQDKAGNCVIKRAGSAGGEHAPIIVIQGHIDMVCEKNEDVQHDFFNDPLKLKRDGDWLKAVGTTLGADNGIGVAAALSLLDSPPSTKLPPLECLFTVAEEVGLIGASAISPELVAGRTMLNLDTEDWGDIFIGCAGAGATTLRFDAHLDQVAAGTMTACQVKVSGLLGGHSGLEIHRDHGNAVRFVAQLAEAAVRCVPGCRVAQLSGGDKRNAIAREGVVTLMVPPSEVPSLTSLVASVEADLKAEYGAHEKDLVLTMKPLEGAAAPTAVMSPGDASRLLALLLALPHGPAKFSHTMPGLVETSNNLAAVKVEGPAPGSSPAAPADRYVIITTTRSSLTPAMEAQRCRIAALAHVCGAEADKDASYPGWNPDVNSPVLQVVRDCYSAYLGGAAPRVASIHAGLECGVLGEKLAGMDMVSFGPTIKGAHSPDERVQISTIEPFWKLVLDVLARLADRR